MRSVSFEQTLSLEIGSKPAIKYESILLWIFGRGFIFELAVALLQHTDFLQIVFREVQGYRVIGLLSQHNKFVIAVLENRTYDT